MDADGYGGVCGGVFEPGDEVGVVFVRAESGADEGVEFALVGGEILFERDGVTRVAGSDALNASRGVDGWECGGFW